MRSGARRRTRSGRPAAAACLLLATALGCADASAPDILLVTIDTLRADHLGCYGYERATSPHIDRLCAEGVVFETAITPTPTTDPAHASILTALHPSRHGVLRNGWTLGNEHETLAERLDAAGYQTHAIVSVAHLGTANGFGQGFDSFDERIDGTSRSPRAATDAAVRWLENAPRPFFLWVHYWDPHGPYAPPPEHDLFAGPDAHALRSFDTGRRTPEGDASRVPRERFARIISLYDGEIHYTDAQVGRLLDALHQRGADRNAIVAVTADHGEMHAEIAETHGYAFDHGEYLFEANLRVPLILRLPGAAHAGARVEGLVSNMDIAPTLLALAGLDGPEQRDGVSLLGHITGRAGPSAMPREALVLQRRADRGNDLPSFHELGVRTPDHKYIWEADAGQGTLFDLRADPRERHPLGSAGRALRQRLTGILDAWRTERTPIAWQQVPVEQREALEALGYLQ